MSSVSMEQCVEHLAGVFGRRYPTTRTGGLGAMAQELAERFELSGRQAELLLNEMEQSRMIRFVQGEQRLRAADSDPYGDPHRSGGAPVGMDLPGGVPRREPVGALGPEAGHWQLGAG